MTKVSFRFARKYMDVLNFSEMKKRKKKTYLANEQ